jgi:hypothetical protein
MKPRREYRLIKYIWNLNLIITTTETSKYHTKVLQYFTSSSYAKYFKLWKEIYQQNTRRRKLNAVFKNKKG